MEETLRAVDGYAGLLFEAMALAYLLIGCSIGFVEGLRVQLFPKSPHDRRAVWMRLLGWLVAALTFQLAADLARTAITQTWQDLGQLAVIALIRTALNYFLERDMADMRAADAEDAA